MNPLLELLQQLLTNGSFPGIPSSFNPAIANAFNQYKQFQTAQDKSRQYDTNTDVMKDIEAYRVNPFKGYIAQKGGMADNGLMLASMVPFVMPGSSLTPQGSDITRGMLTPLVQNMMGGGMGMGEMKKGGSIHIDPSKKGTFKAQASRMDMSVQEAAAHILANKDQYSPEMVKKANFARNFAHQEGGIINTTGYTPGTKSFNNPVNIIPSNNITMKNTPFPVMAIPNNGLSALLMPGMNANFPGASHVLEFPLMQYGGLSGLQPFDIYDRGGRIARRKERLERRLEKAIRKGKEGKVRRLTRRLDDIAHGGSGLTGFGSFLEDAGNTIGKLAKVAGTAAQFIPGVGTVVGGALSAGGGLLDSVIQTDEERGVGTEAFGPSPSPNKTGAALRAMFPEKAKENMANRFGFQQPIYVSPGSLFNRINPPQTQGYGLFSGNFNQSPGVMANTVQQNPLSYLSQQFQGATPGPFGGVAGGTGFGDMSNLLNSLTPLLGLIENQNQQGTGKYGGMVKKKKKYQMGGFVEEPQMVPIQAEKGEYITHLDNTITKVNATKKHSQMDEDEVTDIVPEGSYIGSADKSMKISFKKADEIIIAIKAQPYEEEKKGKVPEQIKLSSLWPKGSKRDMTVAELFEIILKKYPTVDRDDIFSRLTNESNLTSRTPYLAQVMKLSEEMKGDDDDGIVGFQKGGKVKRMQSGGQSGTDWLGVAQTLLPLIGGIFGGGSGGGSVQNTGQVSPLVQNGILGTIPTYQFGVNQNIAAQQGVLNQGIEDFSALGNQLIQNARNSAAGQNFANLGVTGLNALGALGTETNLPRLDLGANRSRILNYSPASASRAAVEAIATPTYDTRAILQELGPRGGAILTQLESDRQRRINEAATQRNSIIDQSNLNKIGQLNAIDQTEQPFNIGQQEKERVLREQRRLGLLGSLGSGLQRGADIQTGLLGQEGNIQSQILPITTQFALQNAQLVGQPLMLGSQNALNALTVLGGLQSGNSVAQYLQNNQPPAYNPTGTGTTNTNLQSTGAGAAGSAVNPGAVGGSAAGSAGSGTNPFAGWQPDPSGSAYYPNASNQCPPGFTLGPDGMCR